MSLPLTLKQIDNALEHRSELSNGTVEYLEQCRLMVYVTRRNPYPYTIIDVTETLIKSYTQKIPREVVLERPKLEKTSPKLTLLDKKGKPMDVAHPEIVKSLSEWLDKGKTLEESRDLAKETVISDIVSKFQSFKQRPPQRCIILNWFYNVDQSLDQQVETYLKQKQKR